MVFFTGGKKEPTGENDVTAAPKAVLAAESNKLAMLSAAGEGLNFEVGKALIDAFSVLGFETAVKVTGGTPQNIEGLLNGNGQLAIVDSCQALDAYNGVGSYAETGSLGNLSVLMTLWANYWQIIVRDDSDIKSMADLAGKKVVADAYYADTDAAIRALLAAAGFNFNVDGGFSYMALQEALNGLEDGAYDALIIIGRLGGHRAELIDQRDFDIRALPVDDATYGKFHADYPCYAKGILPVDYYNTQENLPTVMTRNLLLVDKNMPEAAVYKLLKDFFAQRELLSEDYSVLQKAVFKENPTLDVGLPFHAGALQFYREQGLME